MAGRIRQSDIDDIKTRVNIADVVGEIVSLKTAGVGSMKGLCPFHDERSPSFHVRPQLGYYHCFGCGESGDAISFLQKMNHLTFAEAVESLAARAGIVLHYEEGGAQVDTGNRARLLAANAAAAAFFRDQLGSPEADLARQFLGERGFDPAAAERFGVGYAPNGFGALRSHLRGLRYTEEELVAAGLLSSGDRGAYDRFRGRLVWPIRDVSGQVVGFGARRLREDDKGPKYLNTPETAIYHKSQVLYGLDLAKRDISRSHQVVVVEGYTDVMAMHLAGVGTAVATCGTAFGAEHIRVLRRILDDSAVGEVVFTFDPDAAGQKAALRAFSEEKKFTAQTYVAVSAEGLDPCDLRIQHGDEAVRRLTQSKQPLFEFAIRQRLAGYNLDTVEGRAGALREAAPIVSDIRDASLKPGYTRELARMTGLDLREVQHAVASAGRAARATPSEPAHAADPNATPPAQRPVGLRDLRGDPLTRLERDALMATLQYPEALSAALLGRLAEATISDPSLAVVRDAIASASASGTGDHWVDRVRDEVPTPFATLVTELAVAPLPEDSVAGVPRYVRGVVGSLVDRHLLRRKTEILGRLQRADPSDAEAYREIQRMLVAIDSERRALREVDVEA